jgi:MoxR-like ATPase
MALGYGGNPYGPAGTGKTESVKALGQALARQVWSARFTRIYLLALLFPGSGMTPAGTGKTESAKALGQALARQV